MRSDLWLRICTTDIIMRSIFVFRIFLSFLFLCFTSSICANKSSGVFISVVKTRILLISLSNSCIKKIPLKPRAPMFNFLSTSNFSNQFDGWTSQWGGYTHLEADVPFLTAQAGQHEEDEREEPREGDSHHGERGRPWQLTQGGATYRTQAEVQPLWLRHNFADLWKKCKEFLGPSEEMRHGNNAWLKCKAMAAMLHEKKLCVFL